MTEFRISAFFKASLIFSFIGPNLQAQGPRLDFPLETIYAEVDENKLRKIASRITFSFSSGTGDHKFQHELNGFGIYQSDSLGPLLVGSKDPRPTSGVSGWTARPKVNLIKPKPGWGEFNTITDTSFFFRSRAKGIPLTIDATIQLKTITIGFGIGFDLIGNHLVFQDFPADSAARPPLATNLVRPVPFSRGNFSIRSTYLTLGYDIYRIKRIILRGDLRAGLLSMGRNFDKAFITPGSNFNIGLNFRREFSEYFSLFVRPSVEFKSYKLKPPGLTPEINHRIQTEYLSFGFNYTIPALPKCYVTACRAQIDHPHGNKRYRSRVHPFFRKQNPGYGENKVRVKPNRARTRKDGAVPR